MNTEQRLEVTYSISVEGDEAVFKFGAFCMRILESGREVTMEDAQEFLDGLS